MAQTPAQIIQYVSGQLNDQEPGFTYIRWAISELLAYLNGGLIEIENYRPDAFAVTQDITLAAGGQQALPAGMSFLKSIDANGATALCPGAPIVQADLNLMRAFYKKPCLPTGGPNEYRVRTYAYDAKNPLIFYVSPPVPAGNTASVTATMVAQAPQYTAGTINNPLVVDQKYYNFLTYWMQAKAYEVDTESATSQKESDIYYKRAYNTIGIQYKQGSDYSSGKFMGQGGDGQMTKQRAP
jgi:hypothetical protein